MFYFIRLHFENITFLAHLEINLNQKMSELRELLKAFGLCRSPHYKLDCVLTNKLLK